MSSGTKMQIIDILVTMGIFIFACLVGKYVMDNVADSWIGFNGPALSALALGGLIWWRVRKVLIKKMDVK